MTSRIPVILGLIAAFLMAHATTAGAQAPSAVGQWQCEYATRNIYRTDAHAVYYQAYFQIQPDGSFQAQGNDPSMGPFQAQGYWQLQPEQGRWWFSARGQRSSQMLGVIEFAFDSYLVGPTQMLLNEEFPTGDQIASACHRVG